MMKLPLKVRWLAALASTALMFSVLGFSLGALAGTKSSSPQVVGRAEKGLVSEHCLPMEIRMDTGAKTSSLSAQNIKLFKKDGQDWVKFTLDPEHSPAALPFELPVVRLVNIRNRKAENQPTTFEKRPVVLMPVTLGAQTQMLQVNLADRSDFHYGMLMGRTAMLQFGLMIDPQLVNTTQAKCQSEPKIVD